jgi:hypothetical protein
MNLLNADVWMSYCFRQVYRAFSVITVRLSPSNPLKDKTVATGPSFPCIFDSKAVGGKDQSLPSEQLLSSLFRPRAGKMIAKTHFWTLLPRSASINQILSCGYRFHICTFGITKSA